VRFATPRASHVTNSGLLLHKTVKGFRKVLRGPSFFLCQKFVMTRCLHTTAALRSNFERTTSF